MSVTDKKLIETAKRARERAYGQYSGYSVGCALVDDNGRIHSGCNVENETYPLGACAETGAISAMVVTGGRRIVTIAVVGGYDEPATCTPCGGCRQRIAEFADDETRILMIDESGEWTEHTIQSLLPSSFRLPTA